MTKWKLVVFVEGEDHGSPITYRTPERSIESYKGIVNRLAQLEDLAEQAWADLNRVGARYAELPYSTAVLVPC